MLDRPLWTRPLRLHAMRRDETGARSKSRPRRALPPIRLLAPLRRRMTRNVSTRRRGEGVADEGAPANHAALAVAERLRREAGWDVPTRAAGHLIMLGEHSEWLAWSNTSRRKRGRRRRTDSHGEGGKIRAGKLSTRAFSRDEPAGTRLQYAPSAIGSDAPQTVDVSNDPSAARLKFLSWCSRRRLGCRPSALGRCRRGPCSNRDRRRPTGRRFDRTYPRSRRSRSRSGSRSPLAWRD